MKSSWDLFLSQKDCNNACDYGASWKLGSRSFFSKETVFIFEDKLPYLPRPNFWKSYLSLPSMDLFDLAPKLQLKTNSLLHGSHSSFLMLTVMPFTWSVHVYCGYQWGGKKTNTNQPKKHILPNQIHEIDSSLLIDCAVYIASNATVCYCSLRAIYILWHSEILCWKKEESKTAKPGLTSQLLSASVSIREV